MFSQLGLVPYQRRRPADWTFYANKHDFACCTSSNEIRLETHFAIFAVSLDACFCTYMQLCNYASEPLLPVWCSTGFLAFEELAKAYNSCSR